MRIRRATAGLGLCAILLLAACGGSEEWPVNRTGATAAPDNGAATLGNAAQPPPDARSTIGFTEAPTEYRYSWPQEAAAIPELDAWLRSNGETLQVRVRTEARREQEAAKKDGYPFRGYSYLEDWSVVADVPALLLMQSEGYSYTGGAHGMPIVTTLFWDKAAKKRLANAALFEVPALVDAIKTRFCKALDDERAKRRGAPVNPNDKSGLVDFVSCVDPSQQTILPVSKAGDTLDTIRVVIMPYEAGPYSEGIYEIDLPIDAATLATVKPAYRSSFTAR